MHGCRDENGSKFRLFVRWVCREANGHDSYPSSKPQLYKRYIDDVIGASSSTRQDLHDFIHYCSTYHSAGQYTFDISVTHPLSWTFASPFATTKYPPASDYKPTDTYSYLHSSGSSYPPHWKNSTHTVSSFAFVGSVQMKLTLKKTQPKWEHSLICKVGDIHRRSLPPVRKRLRTLATILPRYGTQNVTKRKTRSLRQITSCTRVPSKQPGR